MANETRPVAFLVKLPPDLHHKLKVEAAQSGSSMTAILVDALEAHIVKVGEARYAGTRPAKPKRRLPRAAPADRAPAATFSASTPEPPRRGHAVACKCGICKTSR
jgi:plasmid stability protein